MAKIKHNIKHYEQTSHNTFHILLMFSNSATITVLPEIKLNSFLIFFLKIIILKMINFL